MTSKLNSEGIMLFEQPFARVCPIVFRSQEVQL